MFRSYVPIFFYSNIDLLKENFHEQIISRNRPENWPPRSCDLTLLDYFLWGYVKSLVYVDKPQSIDALEANITRVIKSIPADMLERKCLKIGPIEWTM